MERVACHGESKRSPTRNQYPTRCSLNAVNTSACKAALNNGRLYCAAHSCTILESSNRGDSGQIEWLFDYELGITRPLFSREGDKYVVEGGDAH